MGGLEFEPPDPDRFPCLRLAREALAAGGAAPCVLNAANEIAVEAFLERRLAFTEIAAINEAVLQQLGRLGRAADLEAVLDHDRQARALARESVAGLAR
jgi:1-deoxy-D-xylulose-5-phosphate reductoisomerase